MVMRSHALVALLLVSCGGAPAPATPTVTMTLPSATASASPPPPVTSASPEAPRVASTGGIRFAGGNGSTIATAIAILGAHGEMDGTASEYSYLAKLYGPQGSAWTIDQQSLLNHSGKSYDALLITLADGTKKTVYFDISDYFGKF